MDSPLDNRREDGLTPLLRAALDDTSDAVLITDTAGVALYVNMAFGYTFGHTMRTAGQVDLESLFANSPDFVDLAAALRESGSSSVEVEMLSSQDGSFTAHVKASTILDEELGVAGLLYLITDISERKRLEDQLREQAIRDPLTGLFNRRHFWELLNRHQNIAKRHGSPLSLCACDLDNFKEVNDTFGHAMGDRVLTSFAQTLVEEIRGEDIAVRLGGDEFCIIFPHVSAEGAGPCLERIRVRFAKMEFAAENGKTFHTSVTLGVAGMDSSEPSAEALMEKADRSLYKAKELGRNCVVVGSSRITPVSVRG